jgi:hypothetical protein
MPPRATQNRQRWAVAAGILAACLHVAAPSFAIEPQPTNRAEELERAALNRGDAAITQERESEKLLGLADALCKKAYTNDTERRRIFTQAGDLQLSAGDLEGLAAGNYEKASKNWTAASVEFSKEPGDSWKRKSEQMAAQARTNRRTALERAAGAYELAADSYVAGKADLPIKSAQSSEKAAGLQEMIADLK